MKGIVALLIVALAQFAAGAHISSCAEEIKHTKDIGAGTLTSDKLKLDNEYFLRALVFDYELEAAGFHCAKATHGKNTKGERIVKHTTVFSEFNIHVTKELEAVQAGDVVKGETGELVKSVVATYDFLKDQDFYNHEERVRYPGITYLRTLFIDNDVWAYWECDRHAHNSEEAYDNRFFYTSGKDTAFSADHAAYKENDEKKGKDGFEGKLFVLPKEDVERCASVKFEANF